MRGTHYIAELSKCRNLLHLADKDWLEKNILEKVRLSGLTILHSFFYQFMKGEEKLGVTGVIVLAESHVTIHTWPEHQRGFVALDVFVCNHQKDNSLAAKTLCDELIRLFSPEKKEIKIIQR